MDSIAEGKANLVSQYLTTEHFSLQGARNATIAEANGRLGHYLAAVGSGVVALAFVANVSELGPAFLAFSAIILPVLILFGLMTLVRTLQISVHDARLAQAINRIHHFYLEMAPEAEPYFSFPQYDDPDSVLEAMMPFHSPLQGLASTPGPIIMINSGLSGALTSVLAAGGLGLNLMPSVIVGLLVLGVTFVLHIRYGERVWTRETKAQTEVRFPAPTD